MQRKLLVICLIIAGSFAAAPLSAQPWQDCVYLWNGFSQSWGYNHRLNRLGDYLQVSPEIDQECRAEWVHTAASGSGADMANFDSWHTQIKLAGQSAVPFQTRLQLDGKEGELIRAQAELPFPEMASKADGWNVTAVLNGFDLRTSEGAKADKIEHFYLSLDSVSADPESGKVWVRIEVEVLFSCSSLECELFKNEVHYEMEVYGLLLSGTDFRCTDDHIGRGLSWTRDSLPTSDPVAASVIGPAGYAEAALGLRSLRLTLDDEHHFAEWATYVQPGDYDAASGRYSFQAGLYFGQWKPDQYTAFQQNYTGKPKIPAKWAVKRSKGSAVMEMGVVLLQFQSAKPAPGTASGEIQWLTRPGRQAAGSDTMAVKRKNLGN